MEDPDLELRGEGGGGQFFFLLPLPAFLPSAIFFFTQNKGDLGPSGPSPRSATENGIFSNKSRTINVLFGTKKRLLFKQDGKKILRVTFLDMVINVFVSSYSNLIKGNILP